jgi:hypothetical protein
MNDPKEKLRFEIAEYVSLEENLTKEDRNKMLNALFDKFFIFDKALHLVTYYDILVISSLAKTSYGELSVPVFVDGKQVNYDDLKTIAFVEAFTAYMNGHHVTRKEVQINYKGRK